jgi:hypothetical protein
MKIRHIHYYLPVCHVLFMMRMMMRKERRVVPVIFREKALKVAKTRTH